MRLTAGNPAVASLAVKGFAGVVHGPNLVTDLLTKPDDTHGYHLGRDAATGKEVPGQAALKRTEWHQAYPGSRAHNPKVAGSNPAPATNEGTRSWTGFLYLGRT